MAIITPVLLLIIAAIFDFAMMFRSWEVVTNAAREGARIGVLPAYAAEAYSVARPGVHAGVRCRGGVHLDDGHMLGPGGGLPRMRPDADGGAERRKRFGPCRHGVLQAAAPVRSAVIGDFFGGNFNSINVASTSMMRTEVQARRPRRGRTGFITQA